MTTSASAERWQRLGALLIQRRTALYPRRSRGEFSEATGLSYRLVYDIEQARRTNFGTTVIGGIEAAYRLTSGAIGRFLDGGELEVQDGGKAAVPSPSAGLSRREHATEDDPALRPYIQSVLRDIYTAAGIMPRLGPGQDLPGIEATPEIGLLFEQIPGSQVFRLEHEAKTWDTDLIDAPAKVRAIARWRRLAAEYEDRARNAMLGRP